MLFPDPWYVHGRTINPGRPEDMAAVKVKQSLAHRLMSRIKERTAEVAVVGLGYVGLPLAEAFAESGFIVHGFDIDDDKIARLNRGESYIRHISSDRVG